MQYFVVDSFSDAPFTGNPAGVCVAAEDLSAETMQKIAAENLLSETAFITKAGEVWNIRFFTPKKEVSLCGHATLGAAYVILNFLDKGAETVQFFSHLSGELSAVCKDGVYYLDFPVRPVKEIPVHPLLEESLGVKVLGCYDAAWHVVWLESWETVVNLKPDLDLIAQIPDTTCIAVTAKGNGDFDYVCRFFGPKIGIPEDPVTGAIQTSLVPFWSERLGKDTFIVWQPSQRGGKLFCENHGDRITIGGTVNIYLEGEITVR